MKARLAKVSLALLSTVFLLGGQDMGSGPVGPEGLGPEFDKPVKSPGDCLALGRVLDEDGHCHDTEEQASTEIFTVRLTGNDIFGVGSNIGMEGLYETNERFDAVSVRGFQMVLSSVILDAVTCAEGGELSALPDPLIGKLSFGNFLNDYIILFFEYNGAEHYFQSQIDDLDNPDPWPPTVEGGPVTVTQGTGQWSIQNQGKNHRDGCTGEGGPGSITWEAEVTNITGT